MAYEFNIEQFDLIYSGLVGLEDGAKRRRDWYFMEQVQALKQSLLNQLPESED